MKKNVKNMPLSGAFTVIFWAAVALSPGTVSAQEETGQLEEVIVTAERRAENIRNVPSSISTVSRDDLDVLSTGGQDVRLLAARVPSLNVESSFGRAFPRFYIRGYGNGDFRLNASQPVSLIYDEVVQENPILKGFPIFDLDQIEVLRGPQGTLFGRNTPGGVVKFDSVRPDSELGGYLNVSDATYNTANIEGAINMPFGEGWAARVSALYQHRDDFVGNSLTGEDDIYEGYNDRAARVQLKYENDKFDALFNVHMRNLDGTARLFRANIIEFGSNDLVDGFDQDSISTDGQNRQELDNLGGSIQLRWNFGAVALSSITGYESLDAYSRGDIDGGYGCGLPFCGGIPFGPGFIPFPSETADGIPTLDQLSQEVRLESLSLGKFNWQAGLYYFDEDYDTEFFSYDSLGGGVQNQYLRANQTNTAWALFGSINYDVTEAFEVRAGVRYTNDEKDFVTGEPEGFSFPPDAVTTAHLSDDNVSWDLSGTYSINDSVNVYARIANGFRGASVQPAGPFGAQSVAEPETNTSYEVGVKADLFDRTASVYFNLFHYEVKDQQLTAVGGASNAVRLLNADKTVGQGAELDVQAYLTPNLLMTLGASYNDTEINDDSISVGTCAACTVTDPVVGGLAVIDGNQLPQAPEIIANFTLRWSMPVGNGQFFAYTDWAYRSEVNFFLYDSTEFTGKELLEGGLRVGYNWSDGKYEAALFGRNITDEEVAVGAIDFNNLTGFLNEPRIVGVQFKARF